MGTTFTNLFEQLDTACLNVFGVPATLNYQGGGTNSIVGVFMPPGLVEDLLPGRGGAVVRFFVRLVDINPPPQCGDQVIIVSTETDTYNVSEVEADNAGGGVLKLRVRSN